MPNYTMFQFFHWFYPKDRALWQHVIKEAPHLSELGITGMWLPPAYKAAGGADSVGYDAYDLYDLGEFDQKGSVATMFGTRDEYLQAVRALHENNIQAYADVVFNHKAGADETEEVMAHKVNPDNRKEVISDAYKIKAYTKFNFPVRQGKYSAFQWDFQCFSGVDWDENNKEGGIYKILNEYGEDWEELLSDERGNFDYLMFSDVEFRNPAVREELKKWGLWYLESTGVDGFRLDAVKHITPSFFPDWLHELRSKTNRELFTVGEYPNSLDIIQKFIEVSNGCMSLFDFPLHHNLRIASQKRKQYDLRKIFNKTLVKVDAIHSVTFVDNHDTQNFREMPSNIEKWFRPHAYALILLREQGYPCVFYPDLYGMDYYKKGKNGKERKKSIKPCNQLEKLLVARKSYAYGAQRDYFEQSNLIGWIREGTDEFPGSGCAVVISNKDESQLEMEIGKRHAGKTFYELTGSGKEKIAVNNDGKASFPVKARSIAVWVAEEREHAD
jgi:alpha-amylase